MSSRLDDLPMHLVEDEIFQRLSMKDQMAFRSTNRANYQLPDQTKYLDILLREFKEALLLRKPSGNEIKTRAVLNEMIDDMPSYYYKFDIVGKTEGVLGYVKIVKSPDKFFVEEIGYGGSSKHRCHVWLEIERDKSEGVYVTNFTFHTKRMTVNPEKAKVTVLVLYIWVHWYFKTKLRSVMTYDFNMESKPTLRHIRQRFPELFTFSKANYEKSWSSYTPSISRSGSVGVTEKRW